MITYGFFNSVSGDRVYNADQMSEYFKGLVSDGVFADVGDGLQVISSGGMAVQVKPGRAIVGGKWIENDANYPLTISAASSTLNRITAVIVKLDTENRLIEITTKDGTPAATPTAPTIADGELCLALVYVAKKAASITQANITDTRAGEDCGWVTGLIKQVDTSSLFIQWAHAYQEFYNNFVSWFETLTETLQVNTYIEEYKKAVSGPVSDILEIALDMAGYNWEASDVIEVYVNGLAAVEGGDYTITNGTVYLNTGIQSTSDNNTVFIRAIKSKIGNPPSGGNTFGPLSITENDTVNSSFTLSDPE